jgi:hypothetical protein
MPLPLGPAPAPNTREYSSYSKETLARGPKVNDQDEDLWFLSNSIDQSQSCDQTQTLKRS